LLISVDGRDKPGHDDRESRYAATDRRSLRARFLRCGVLPSRIWARNNRALSV